ncbi:MAG: hypothetical protein IPL39_17970, partial [Opitutaceae bacterium]|nr:hypothetical protein [Opitutaceae bacterium]
QNLAMQGQARQAALQSLQQTDPTGYANREALGQQVMADVALGDSLSPAQQRRMEQQMREAQASRGNILGDAPMVDEVMAITGYGDQLKQQRQAAAMGFLNSKDLLPQFQAAQGQNFAGQLNLGNNIESGAQAALGQFKPQTGYQGAAVADPLAAFNVDANTAKSNGYGDALARYNPQTGYESMSANSAAALYNPQTGYQAMTVANPLTQTAVNANASTGYEFTNPFNTQNSQMQTVGVQTQTAVNPLMPNFSSTGQVSMQTPNFQATQAAGPNLSPTPISTGLSNIWNQNAGTQGQNFAQQNFQNQNSLYQGQQNRNQQMLSGLMQLGGVGLGAAI